MFKFLIVFILCLKIVSCFHFPKLQNQVHKRFIIEATRVDIGSVNSIPNGERKIIDTSAGTIIVANVDNKLYAVNAKCPHLGLPMKKGKIDLDDNGNPQITCNFHNSKFSLEDGKCNKWCTGVLGIPNTGFIAGISGKFGGEENSPATTYKVLTDGDVAYLEI